MFGDAGQKAPHGGLGANLAGLNGKLDVQDLSVGAQHIPRHVNFQKYKLLIDNLQDAKSV